MRPISLLRSTREQIHSRIAHALESQFPATAKTQPELVAHHYIEGGLGAQAILYWQRAGERALKRWANLEAISHLTRGLELLEAAKVSTGRDDNPAVDESKRCTLLMALGEAQLKAGQYLEAKHSRQGQGDDAGGTIWTLAGRERRRSWLECSPSATCGHMPATWTPPK